MILSIIITIFFIVYIYWLYSRYQNLWRYIAKFPGPFAVPIFGNVLQIGFKPEDYLTVIRRWFKEYNFQPFRLYGGSQPYIVFTDKDRIEAVLSSTTLTYKDDIYDYMRPWLGRGLLTSNGQHWVNHRKMITPSFHFQILQDFLSIFNETTDRFMKLLDTFAVDGKMFDIQNIVTRSTIDVICETAMGTRVNSIDGEPSRIVDAINDVCNVIQERVFSALKRFDFFFQFTSDYYIQKRALKLLRNEFYKIIENRRKIIEETNNLVENPNNDFKRPKLAFLDNLITATVAGRPLTMQEIYEEVSTFMFEGHDTTASSISFTIFCLSRHSEIQEKALQEQLQIFGTDFKRNPTYQELQNMKYLELIIKESLRIFPSVPIIGRTMTKLTEIDGYVIPKNATILIPIIGVATDERNFENPFTFQPERFEIDKRTEANPFDYVPFSAGPRNCIGQKFALLEIKVTISKILRHFEILPAIDGLSSGIYDPTDVSIKNKSPYDPELAALVTLKSVNGVYIRLKRRNYN